jgi:RHS repeat-associated protein
MSYVREGRGKNQFLYNGKELVEGFALGWYDYGARYYAPDLGRFSVVDRFSSKYLSLSSYSYASNNPALIVDINGDSLWISHKDQKYLYDNGKLFLDGKEFSGKQKGFLKKTVNALNIIIQTEEGSSMINQLQDSENNFTILSSNLNPDGNKNAFDADNQIRSHANQILTDPEAANTKKVISENNIDISGGSGGNLFWDPNGNSVPVVGGKFNTNGTTDLAHELSHAVDSDLGMSDNRPHLHEKVERSEWNAVYRENRVRQGLNLPLRTHYIKQTNSRGMPLKGVGPRMLTPANKPLKPTWLK